MKRIAISSVRQDLPSIVDRVVRRREGVVITRHGQAVAKIVPAENEANVSDEYPLRGLRIEIASDFDVPSEELWEAVRGNH